MRAEEGVATVAVLGGTAAIGAGVYLWLKQKPKPGQGVLEVTVQDYSTGAAISGASVSANGNYKTTGTDGKASFNLDERAYTVSASKTGYQTESRTGQQVQGGMKTSITLRLRETGVGEKYYKLTVEVVGRASSGGITVADYPIDGATVRLSGAEDRTKITSEGSASWASLRAGDYNVTITHPSFDELTGTFTLDEDKTVTFRLSGGPIEVELLKVYKAMDGHFIFSFSNPPAKDVMVSINVDDPGWGPHAVRADVFETDTTEVVSRGDPRIKHDYGQLDIIDGALLPFIVRGEGTFLQVSVRGEYVVGGVVTTVWSHYIYQILKGVIPEPTATVTFYATDSSTGAPITNFATLLWGASDAGTSVTKAVLGGALGKIPVGTYNYKVMSAGYRSKTGTVRVDPPSVRVDVSLSKS